MSFINTVSEYRQAGGTANLKGTSFENIEPALVLAADTHLRPLLGDTFFDALRTAYAAATHAAPLTGWRAELVPLLQRAQAHLATPDIIDLLQVQVSDAGVQIESSGSRKTAFQWQVREIKAGAVRRGWGALDRVLTYLEGKFADAGFAAWATSPAAQVAAELLLNSAADFQRHVDISGSRLTFQSLVPLVRKTELLDLEPVLGADFLAAIREMISTRTLTDGNEKRLVLDFLQPAVAYGTLARALRERAFRLNGSTLELTVIFDTDDATRTPATTAAAGLLAGQLVRAEEDAAFYLARLRTYLRAKASATVFPLYFESDLYRAGVTGPDPVAALNTSDSKLYFGL